MRSGQLRKAAADQQESLNGIPASAWCYLPTGHPLQKIASQQPMPISHPLLVAGDGGAVVNVSKFWVTHELRYIRKG